MSTQQTAPTALGAQQQPFLDPLTAQVFRNTDVQEELNACGFKVSSSILLHTPESFSYRVDSFVQNVRRSLLASSGVPFADQIPSEEELRSSPGRIVYLLRQAQDFFLDVCIGKIFATHNPESSSLPLKERANAIRNWILNDEADTSDTVRQLNLSGQQLPFVPLVIFKLRKLFWLSVSNNNLQFIPEDIRRLKQLAGLYAANNKIESLPYMKGLKHLSDLILRQNSLSTLPSLPCRKLRGLDISLNKFPKIPAVVFQAKGLEELYVEGTGLREIPSSIEKLRKLQLLSLKDNSIRSVPKALTRLASKKSLQEVDLSINPLCRPLNRHLSQLKPSR